MLKIIENGATVLMASEGMVLTNGSAYGTIVRLGKDDDGSTWYEIPEPEVEQLTDDTEATELDYQNALRELGVNI